MADTSRRVPLWLIAVVGGLAVFTVLGVFLFGSYSGLGSSL
jgi:photosystem II PsbJ protein